jgi:hypothetical protein
VALATASSTPVSIEDAKEVLVTAAPPFYLQERGVPGVADLAGKEADAIGLDAGGERRIKQADARVTEVRPIALSFQSNPH